MQKRSVLHFVVQDVLGNAANNFCVWLSGLSRARGLIWMCRFPNTVLLAWQCFWQTQKSRCSNPHMQIWGRVVKGSLGHGQSREQMIGRKQEGAEDQLSYTKDRES